MGVLSESLSQRGSAAQPGSRFEVRRLDKMAEELLSAASPLIQSGGAPRDATGNGKGTTSKAFLNFFKHVWHGPRGRSSSLPAAPCPPRPPLDAAGTIAGYFSLPHSPPTPFRKGKSSSGPPGHSSATTLSATRDRWRWGMSPPLPRRRAPVRHASSPRCSYDRAHLRLPQVDVWMRGAEPEPRV